MEEIQLGQETKKTSPLGLIILILMGLFLIYLIGQRTHLTCTRANDTEVDCVIKSMWMGSITVSSREASGVRNAYVDQNYDDDEDSYTYRVVLRTKSGDVPVNRAFSSGNAKKTELAQEINALINDQSHTEVEFDFKDPGTYIGAIVLGAFLATGIGGLIARKRKKVVSPTLMGAKEN